MPNYKKMYFQLASKVADAVDLLIAAQQQGEDTYVENEPVFMIKSDTGEKHNESESC